MSLGREFRSSARGSGAARQPGAAARVFRTFTAPPPRFYTPPRLPADARGGTFSAGWCLGMGSRPKPVQDHFRPSWAGTFCWIAARRPRYGSGKGARSFFFQYRV
jgi:hypothetical protein